MKCNICGSENVKTIFNKLKSHEYRGHSFTLKKCLHCRVGFLDPQPLFTEIEDSCYADNYHAYRDSQKSNGLLQKLKNFVKRSVLNYYLGYGSKKFWQSVFYSPFLRISFYPRFVSGGRILDLGCGAGKYLHYLEELGWDGYGLDVSKRAVEGARASGLDQVSEGELKDANFPNDFFDAVNMHHVFEHLPNPNETLQEVKRILKPGGEVIITLPNFSSLASKVFGKYWGGIDIPRHLFHFNHKSLEFVLAKNGFEMSEVWYSDIFRGFAAGLSYLFFSNARKHEKYFLPFGIALDLIFDPILQKLSWGDQITVKAKRV